jgi:hypothetical protein
VSVREGYKWFTGSVLNPANEKSDMCVEAADANDASAQIIAAIPPDWKLLEVVLGKKPRALPRLSNFD